jgi:hypothetical protein
MPVVGNRDHHRIDVLVFQDAFELLLQHRLPALGGFEFRARPVPDRRIQIAKRLEPRASASGPESADTAAGPAWSETALVVSMNSR